MVSDLEIKRSAKVLINRYGPRAEAFAKERTESWFQKGALEGAGVWQQILVTVQELQNRERPQGRAQLRDHSPSREDDARQC